MNYLAIDIGGTEVKIGIVNEKGVVLSKTSVKADFDAYETPLLVTALKGAETFVNDLAKQKGIYVSSPAHACELLGLCGIGVSATGVIDTVKGTVAGSGGHIPGWQGSEIKRRFEEWFGLETRVINDANSVAAAEHYNGSAKGISNAVILTLGTGIGGGIIVNGRILEGGHGYAGEIGRMTLNKNDHLTPAGNEGTFEAYGSTKALVKKAEKSYSVSEGLNGRKIFADAENGDPEALALIDEWISDIAAGIISLVYIFDPEIIVIGGGVSAQKELLIRPLEERVRKRLMPVFAEKLKIVAATHKNDAGMIGAVCTFLS